MSRSWRIEFDGALYHVLSRGNDQQKYVIFQGKIDKKKCLEKIVQ
jgi:hypothetical protein